jgi:hypothetical protein
MENVHEFISRCDFILSQNPRQEFKMKCKKYDPKYIALTLSDVLQSQMETHLNDLDIVKILIVGAKEAEK